MEVAELCTRDVVTAFEDETVLDVARRMRENHVGTVVVVEPSGGGARPVGILTDRDIVVSQIAEGARALDKLHVGDAMSRSLTTVGESEMVSRAIERMQRDGVRRMPVVDDDHHLVGILAFDDVVEHVTDQMQRLSRVVSSEIAREMDRDRPTSPD
jgi:CBS domain-containing protein